MTPNPILKVLSVLNQHRVRYLLMGGQACVLYGAAEFSRDTDIAVLADADNLRQLSAALDELQAVTIAVPPFDASYLLKGHAVHFRCKHPEASESRLDVMAIMRGVAPFAELWERRTTIEYETGIRIDLLSLPDLVAAKKTQRDKDWPMLRRLVESHYLAHRDNPQPEQIAFWLRESRTPTMLLELAVGNRDAVAALLDDRPLISLALGSDESELAEALADEECAIREADRQYWSPLKAELERLRHRG